MSSPPKRTWAQAASGSLPATSQTSTTANTKHYPTPPADKPPPNQQTQPPHHHKLSTSPAHIPRTSSPEQSTYVLTLLTDPTHHNTMTALRRQYFPPRLNKLDAHITLFHALPGSRLDATIVPTLLATAASTAAFPLTASAPFRLRKGIAVGVPKGAGGDAACAVHERLRGAWADFLSEQDAGGGFRAHYTVMNKVDDEAEVERAWAGLRREFKACPGMVEGLSLFRYERGFWAWERDFRFNDKEQGA